MTEARTAAARTAASGACASAGVALLIFAGVAPDEWYPAAALFAHVLTPCLDRIAVWRKQLLR
jgi:hypothetical protein